MDFSDIKAAPRSIAKRDLIEGLGKGLRIIEAFDDEHPRLSPSEAGRICEMTRTAARRYLLSLVHYGYAATDGKLFWLTPQVLKLGQSYLGSARLPRLVQPFIQRASMASGETLNVSVLDGHEVVYVARSNSPRVVSIGYHVGARLPAHVATPGIVMLSELPDGELHEWINAHDFSGHTPHTITDRAQFLDRVLQARAAGYGLTEQMLDAGLRGIAVALKDRKGQCKAAVGMTLPMQPLSREQTIERMLPLLQEAAQALRPII